MPPAGAWVDTIDYSFANSPAVQAFDWIGCIVFFASAVLLGSKLYTFKPEGKHVLYFFGYEKEPVMFPVFVLVVAFTAYWAKVCNHLSGVEGSQLYTYRYVDYIGTCPLLTLTLCATLNLPYKLTSAIFMMLVIVAGLMAFWSPAPGRYVWFGLGCVIFAFTWYRIVTLSQVRFLQYFGKKHRITYRVGNSQKSKRRESFATKAGLRDKRVRGPIQIFLGTYFIVWTGYPILWLLEDFRVLDHVVIYIIHVLLDIITKVVFGFGIVRFQFLLSKMDLRMDDLKVTLADMLDDYHEALKEDKAKRRERNRNLEKYGTEVLSPEPQNIDYQDSRDGSNEDFGADPYYGSYGAQYPQQAAMPGLQLNADGSYYMSGAPPAQQPLTPQQLEQTMRDTSPGGTRRA